MSKIETNRKLELVRAIRMQNQQDRQLLKYRESILYPGEMKGRNGEIFSLEEAALPPVSESYFGKAREGEGRSQSSSFLKGLRLRLILAMLLFLGFVYCEIKGISLGDRSMESLAEMMKTDQITELDFGELFSFQ